MSDRVAHIAADDLKEGETAVEATQRLGYNVGM